MSRAVHCYYCYCYCCCFVVTIEGGGGDVVMRVGKIGVIVASYFNLQMFILPIFVVGDLALIQ